ncbi:MAG TPA: hypothetical protein VIC33_07850 [Vicinamibacterales bacterium]
MRAPRALGWGLVAAATTTLSRTAVRKAMHTRNGTPRLPGRVLRESGVGRMLLLAVATGAALALGDVLREQRQRVAHS